MNSFAAIDQLCFKHSCEGMSWQLLASSPRPVIAIEWQRKWNDDDFRNALMFITMQFAEAVEDERGWACIRCVDPERLPVILRQGCDVEPPNAVMWVDKYPDKALEYGGDESKVMLVISGKLTEASYIEVGADMDAAELNSLKLTYPTTEPSRDGTKLWLSRLPENDRRVASPYESEHGRWIPGDPFEALLGVFVLGRNMNEISAQIRHHVAACKAPSWQ